MWSKITYQGQRLLYNFTHLKTWKPLLLEPYDCNRCKGSRSNVNLHTVYKLRWQETPAISESLTIAKLFPQSNVIFVINNRSESNPQQMFTICLISAIIHQYTFYWTFL